MINKYYFYQFEDGYFCYYAGKMTKCELNHEIAKHGKVVRMEVKKY